MSRHASKPHIVLAPVATVDACKLVLKPSALNPQCFCSMLAWLWVELNTCLVPCEKTTASPPEILLNLHGVLREVHGAYIHACLYNPKHFSPRHMCQHVRKALWIARALI